MVDDEQKTDDAAASDDNKPEDKPAEAVEEKKDAPAAAPKEEPKSDDSGDDAKDDDKPSKEYSKEVQGIVEQVEKMTVLEVADLVSAIEDKFGVSAAPVAVAGAAPAGGDADGGEDEKSSFTVHLVAAGDKKIEVIKAVREITDLGLGEAKGLVDEAPKDVKTDVPKDEANEAKQKLEAAGATVELK